jgi:hypothetical protein
LLERGNRQNCWREGTDRIVGEREQKGLVERGNRIVRGKQQTGL